jgi:Spy/CpxP family protein refolding chaperone
MNIIRNNKLLSTVIILLLVINATTIAFLMLRKDIHLLPPPPKQSSGAFNFLVKELKLDSTQIKVYQNLKEAHKENVDALREELKNTKDSLFELLKQVELSDIKVQSKLDSIALLNKRIDEITFSHFKQVRSICSDTQKKKFDEIIAEAMRMQGPQRSQHQPPPPRNERERNGEPRDMPPPPND